MKLTNTTEEFQKFYDNDVDRTRALFEQGFKNIDISFYTEHIDNAIYQGDDWKQKAYELLNFGNQNGIKFVQAHLPGGNPLDENGIEELTEVNIRCIDVCGILGIKYAVIHMGWKKDISKQEFYEKNRDYIQLLLPALERNNVILCVENSCKANLGKYFYFFDGKELREFIDYVDSPFVAACWDTGHANIEGPQYQDILALGDKLRALHINDNMGQKDDHMMPYMGTLNIDEVMTVLLEIGFNEYFTFECGTSVIFNNHWLNKRKVFEKDTRALNPNVEIKKSMVKTTYEVGRQILLAYNCLEEE